MTDSSSQEAIALLEDTGGYNAEATIGNAPTSLDESFYFASAPWRHIKEGYSVPYPDQKVGPRPATQTMVEQAHRQLMEAIGVDSAPQPSYAHLQNWRRDPWGGGWHAWQSNNAEDNDHYMIQSRQPVPAEPVYLVGECWSNVKGWVWGALNSSEAMLQVNLGFKWPEQWLARGGIGPGTDDLNDLA